MIIGKSSYPKSDGDASSLALVDTDNQGANGYGTSWHAGDDFIAMATAVASEQVMVYSFNGTTLTQVETVDLGATAMVAAWHPTSEHLAVSCQKANSQVIVYSWNGSDTLTSVETVDYGANATGCDWHPNGDYLAIGGANAAKDIVIYSWNGSDTLTEVETVNVSETCSRLKWSNDGNYLSVSGGSTLALVYSWNGSDTLTLKDSVNVGTWIYNTVWSKSDDYVFYGTSDAAKTVIAYSFDGTNLVEVDTINFGANHRASVGISQWGEYLFVAKYHSVAGSSDKWIYAYAWDEAAETLTENSSITVDSIGFFTPMVSNGNKFVSTGIYFVGGYTGTIRVDSTGLRPYRPKH